MRISWEEYERIKDLKELDVEICKFGHLNLLNLGWEIWGKWFCVKHEEEYVLCKELCLPVVKKLGCELVRKRSKRTEEPAKSNLPYNWAGCYGCGKELKGAGKHGIIKNRNNPGFWGISSVYKILCLECMGEKFYARMKAGKRKSFRKYLRRGYD